MEIPTRNVFKDASGPKRIRYEQNSTPTTLRAARRRLPCHGEACRRIGRAPKAASALATCLREATKAYDPVYQLTQYSIGEIISNCRQHSGSRGFASSQYARKTDLARIAIADRGLGILDSFRQNVSPFYRDGMTDAEALAFALQPCSSPKTHLPDPPYGHVPNLGIDLSMISAMVA